MKDNSFYQNKNILITGHTGFKGAWLCEVLLSLGANVYGYALEPQEPSLFSLCKLDQKVKSCYGDIRDFDTLFAFFKDVKPELIIHMAAQPIVKEGYENPRYTYDVNVMGTVNILECIRQTDDVKSFLNVTTDKVYLNQATPLKEDDILNGFDPYSNSKSCSELVSETYRRSFFDESVAISTARAGNTIGGGDFGENRLMPDCMRAVLNNESIVLRNPESMRPYQHVLDVLHAYLTILEGQYYDTSLQGAYNVGPDKDDCLNNLEMIKTFIEDYQKQTGKELSYQVQSQQSFQEADVLTIDSSKLKKVFNFKANYSIQQAIHEIVSFTIQYQDNKEIEEYLQNEIKKYFR